MAYKKIQVKRGTKVGMPVLRSGEPGFTQDEKSLYVGDGTSNQRFLNEVQLNTRIDEKIAPVTQSITNNVATLNQTITSNVTTLNQTITSNVATLNQTINTKEEALNKKITDKVTINENPQNVNFIENKIVKDGLVSDTSLKIDLLNDFTLMFKYESDGLRNGFICRQGAATSDGGFGIGVASDGRFRCGLSDTTNYLYSYVQETSNLGNVYNILFSKKNGEINFKVNNQNVNIQYGNIVNSTKYITFTNASNILLYNKALTSKEIQHNFSILNNSPSINRINDYALSTDTDHVLTRTGVTDEERYTELLKATCKEFTSNGEAITVSNGIAKQKVLSGKIEGQTVKNYLTSTVSKFTINTNTKTIIGVQQLEASASYSIFYNITNVTGTNRKIQLVLSDGTNYYKDTASEVQVGLYRQDFTTRGITTITGIAYYASTVDENITIDGIVVVKQADAQYVKNVIAVGLNSTQAIISNNNLKYSFYMPTIDGKTRVMRATKGTQNWVENNAGETRDTAKYDYKLESISDLGSVPTAYDYIDRARKVKVVNTKEIVLNGSGNWIKYHVVHDTIDAFQLSIDGLKNNTTCISSLLKYKQNCWDDREDFCISVHPTYNTLWIAINKSRLSSADVSGFKAWLASNPITVRYQLATPIEIPLTDAEIKAYDAYRKVIDLNGIGDVRNSLEIKEDGSGILIENNKLAKSNSRQGWALNSEVTDSFVIMNNNYAIFKANSQFVIYDKITNDKILVIATTSSGKAQLKFLKTSFSSLEECFVWLDNNSFNFIGQLATPIVTTIDKSLVPAILTQATNEFKFGDGVMATKATISAPVNRIAEMQKEIDEIKALIQTPSNINLTMNYIEDEYNKNQSVEGVM